MQPDYENITVAQKLAELQDFDWFDSVSIEMLKKEGLTSKVDLMRTIMGGIRYTGEWSGTIRHGRGTQIWPDGTRYDGYFVNDR